MRVVFRSNRCQLDHRAEVCKIILGSLVKLLHLGHIALADRLLHLVDLLRVGPYHLDLRQITRDIGGVVSESGSQQIAGGFEIEPTRRPLLFRKAFGELATFDPLASFHLDDRLCEKTLHELTLDVALDNVWLHLQKLVDPHADPAEEPALRRRDGGILAGCGTARGCCWLLRQQGPSTGARPKACHHGAELRRQFATARLRWCKHPSLRLHGARRNHP
mmetsp:Transcript_40618/g.107375  ORF Transcript_40618/g.107375 Transcript_40618/m.107375 type:complete len:219 (-) Transcript_40618:8-664(-)